MIIKRIFGPVEYAAYIGLILSLVNFALILVILSIGLVLLTGEIHRAQ